MSHRRYYKEELPGLDKYYSRDLEMFKYTIKGGQCFRGVLVVSATLELLKMRGAPAPDEDRMQQIMSVGWALEILQAAFLVADDIMDESQTRRGKKCWYKVDEVHGYNDVFKLEHFAFWVLKANLKDRSELYEICAMFHDVILKTTFGQGLDLEYANLLTQVSNAGSTGFDEEKLTSQYSMKAYEKIVMYKTSYYTFYLPLVAAYALGDGEDIKTEEGMKKRTSKIKVVTKVGLELGHYFQVQDDYLDVYGNPKVTGKIGTDILQRKLTWLMAKAVEASDSKGLRELFTQEKDHEKRVRAKYKTLGLRTEYMSYERAVCDKIRKWMDDGKAFLPTKTISLVIDKIYSSRVKKEFPEDSTYIMDADTA